MVFKVSCNLNHSDSVTAGHRAAQEPFSPSRKVFFTPYGFLPCRSHPYKTRGGSRGTQSSFGQCFLCQTLPRQGCGRFWIPADPQGLHPASHSGWDAPTAGGAGQEGGALSTQSWTRCGSQGSQLRAVTPALSPGHPSIRPSVWLSGSAVITAGWRHGGCQGLARGPVGSDGHTGGAPGWAALPGPAEKCEMSRENTAQPLARVPRAVTSRRAGAVMVMAVTEQGLLSSLRGDLELPNPFLEGFPGASPSWGR